MIYINIVSFIEDRQRSGVRYSEHMSYSRSALRKGLQTLLSIRLASGKNTTKEMRTQADVQWKDLSFSGVHMSISVGIPNVAAVTIGGKTAATIRALNEATEEASAQALGVKTSDGKVKTSAVGLDKPVSASEAEDNSTASVAQKVLQRRLKELQEQLRQQQQDLVAAQAAPYPTPEAKLTAVSAIQGQIAQTNAALLETANALYKEMTKSAGSGAVVNTTA